MRVSAGLSPDFPRGRQGEPNKRHGTVRQDLARTGTTRSGRGRLTEALSAGAPRLFVIEAEYALSLARAETTWIDSVIDDIRTGALTWPTAPSGNREEPTT